MSAVGGESEKCYDNAGVVSLLQIHFRQPWRSLGQKSQEKKELSRQLSSRTLRGGVGGLSYRRSGRRGARGLRRRGLPKPRRDLGVVDPVIVEEDEWRIRRS